MSASEPSTFGPIPLRRVHGETALLVISLAVAILVWGLVVVLVVKAVGAALVVAIYVLVVAALLFLVQVGFITHVRGNGARLGPEQFPELYERVQALGARMGLRRVPEAYLMQAGGALNALATRFMWRPMIVLYSDLLEACGDNGAARDMIIAHELAHVRAGHLRLRWLLFPSLLVPFLGAALSRAREYTCDLMGFTGAGDRTGALLGLSILSVGGKYAPKLSHGALAAQRRELNTGWMTLGQWVASHPPMAKRLAALDPALSPETRSAAGGTLRALSIMLGFVVGVAVVAGGAAYFVAQGAGGGLGRLLSLGTGQPEDFSSFDEEGFDSYVAPDTAAEDLEAAFASVSAVLDEEIASGGSLPEDYEGLVSMWSARMGDEPIPSDPYDGREIGYLLTDDGYRLWSSGPDAEPDTPDDITRDGP